MDTLPTGENDREPLCRLIYVSRRTAGVSDHDVVELALKASRRNRVFGVTGCLWFGDQQFFQILEGPKSTVENLFARIGLDRRHCGVRLLSQSGVSSREFTRWALTHLADDENVAVADLVTHYVGNRQPPETITRGLSLSVFERVSAFVCYAR